MRPGRELDTFISQHILGYTVKVKQRQLWEVTPLGERPLRKYSRDISAAWEVVEKLSITLIPVEGEGWFAFVGTGQPWRSPAAFLEFLQQGKFVGSGAAVGKDPAETICFAAAKSLETNGAVVDISESQERDASTAFHEATRESESAPN